VDSRSPGQTLEFIEAFGAAYLADSGSRVSA